MDTEGQSNLSAPTQQYLSSIKVFPLIPHLKKDAISTIDSALSWEQLTAADINFSIVRPLVNKYAKLHNLAVVYACLVVRSYFLSEADSNLVYSGIMAARANLCEILAMKLLTRFASDHIQLVAVLTTEWHPLTGAPAQVVTSVKNVIRAEDDIHYGQSALELAISSKAKAFLAHPVSQKVVNDMYTGRIVFSTASINSLLADNYKHRAIEIYDYRKSPLLDHYRLRVPKYAATLEFFNFVVLLSTFVLCLWKQDVERMTEWEIAFIVFASGFTLKEYSSSTEHGWNIYIANIWNIFDSSFVAVFLVYLGLRIQGLSTSDVKCSKLAFDFLACGACILFPRLAFFTISDNVVVLSLRAMTAEFLFFLAIACVCFSGLLFTLWILARGTWTLKSIAWLMVQVWFGSTYLSFAQATSFHEVFGPILMTIFAALSNSLLLTILISILSNTVARVNANATREYLYQFAISTIGGVKSDALFSYQPPFNLLAFMILKPASWIISPRALHSLNVFLIKLTSFPILIIISLYEHYFSAGQKIRQSGKGATQSLFNSLPRHMPFFESIVGSPASDMYDAIFEVESTHEVDLFDGDSEDERPALRSIASHGSLRTTRTHHHLPPRPPFPKNLNGSPLPSPIQSANRPSAVNLNDPQGSGEDSLRERSALSRLYAPRLHISHSESAAIVDPAESGMRRVEELLNDVRELPVQNLKDEMRELQDRQARIENLLLVLTRGMRNDGGGSPQPPVS